MRVTLACMVTIALLSCTQPTEPTVREPASEEQPAGDAPGETTPDPEPATEPEPEPEPATEPEPTPEPPPAPETEPEPAWQPDGGTIYLFYDEPGGDLFISETPTAESWRSRYFVYRQYAQDNGMVFVAGEPPEGT